jgi:hypothetical protein
MHIFKYIPPDFVDIIFKEKNLSIKCSYPKDFNDPYELSLTIDFNKEPETLAFYQDVVGEIPQIPVTCFSTSPEVIPMWAHYAKNHEGFVIEFDEEILKKHFKDYRFDNVIYKDTKDEELEELLARAHVIRKPRYTHMLHRRLFFVAYFTKNSCWSYESERRMLIDEKETYKIGENIIIDIPYSAVKSIILGARCSKNTSDKIIKMCNNFRLNHYKTRIGKSSTKPYFLTKNGRTSIFKDGCFSVSKNYCTKCGEPTSLKKHCGWCAINESHIIAAQQKNVYRILASAGILESYIDGMNKI